MSYLVVWRLPTSRKVLEQWRFYAHRKQKHAIAVDVHLLKKYGGEKNVISDWDRLFQIHSYTKHIMSMVSILFRRKFRR